MGNDNTSSKTTGLTITNMTCLAKTISSNVPDLGGALNYIFQVDLDNKCSEDDEFTG